MEQEVILNALRESYLSLAGDMRPVPGKAKAFTCATDGHGKERNILIPQGLMDFPRPPPERRDDQGYLEAGLQMQKRPAPLTRFSYRDYAAGLQQLYQELKVELGPAVVAQARTAARAQIKQHTLPVAAQGLLPPVPNAPPKPRSKKTLKVRSRPQRPTAYSPAPSISAPPPPLPVHTAPGRKLVRKCRRKLAHFDFLATLLHARRLASHCGNHNFNIYPCQVCNGSLPNLMRFTLHAPGDSQVALEDSG